MPGVRSEFEPFYLGDLATVLLQQTRQLQIMIYISFLEVRVLIARVSCM